MARGGKRPGAGRKPRASFSELVSTAERKKFVEFVLETYMGDMRLAMWMGDQLFGRASQAVELSGKDGGPIQIEGVDISIRK